jgi:hypothetical protein
MNQKLKHLLAWMVLSAFIVSATVLTGTNVSDAQKTDLTTGKRAILKMQDNKDGTVTLIVVVATPLPTATPTPTHTPPPTATASPTPTV